MYHVLSYVSNLTTANINKKRRTIKQTVLFNDSDHKKYIVSLLQSLQVSIHYPKWQNVQTTNVIYSFIVRSEMNQPEIFEAILKVIQ